MIANLACSERQGQLQLESWEGAFQAEESACAKAKKHKSLNSAVQQERGKGEPERKI